MKMVRQSRRKRLSCCLFIASIVATLLVVASLLITYIIYRQMSFVSTIKNQLSKEKQPILKETVNEGTKTVDYSVTMVVPSSVSHLSKLNFAIASWIGEISVGLCVFPEENTVISLYLDNLMFPSRVTVTSYNQRTAVFPINTLRNLAIQQASTTHVFVTDIDVIPSPTLSGTFLALSDEILGDDTHAIIIPLFEMKFRSISCNTWFRCLAETWEYTKISRKQIAWCLAYGGCTNLGDKDANKYLSQKWTKLPSSSEVTELSCWENQYQEPYIIVSKSNFLPLFDESFVNYGFNKVEWINHLRYLDYKFSVLSQSWAFHSQHDKSEYYMRFRESDSKSTKKLVTSKTLFDRAMKKYESQFIGKKRLPFCSYLPNIVGSAKAAEPVKNSGKKRIFRRKN